MPGTSKNTPAQWMGGQRRKLVRRNRSNSGPPQSSTMPILNPDSAAASLVSSISTVGSGYTRDRQSEDSFDQQSAESRMGSQDLDYKVQSHNTTGDAVKPGAPYTSFADGPLLSSPKLTATDSKKSHGLFHSKKPKTLEGAPPSSRVVTSPLPVSTPSKAAKFFGLETKPTVLDSRRHAHIVQDHDPQVGASVRPELRKQFSLPLLTRFKPGTHKQTHSKEPDLEPEEPKPAKAGKAAATKAHSGPEGFQKTHSCNQAAPRPVAKHYMRRKIPKYFQRMSPITEASVESLRPAYREGEDVTELGVISEYEHYDLSYSFEHTQGSRSDTGHKLFRSQNGTFKLDEADLSPSDDYHDEGASEEEDIHVVHPGNKVNLGRARAPRGHEFHLRSPLQDFEDAHLDATEEELWLEARRRKMAKIEAERQAIDAEIAVLWREHERLKLGFSASNSGADKSVEAANDAYDDDLASLNSSIDLDEEPTILEAKAFTSTRITPAMVKLVDIPPRKKKAVPDVGSSSSTSVLDRLAKNGVAAAASAENTAPPLVTHYHHEDPDCTTKPKKSKLPRDESRLLVQNWVLDYNSTTQRPISTRVDPDVLADQETPPAPFPKSDEDLSIPPIKPQSDPLEFQKPLPKHQCINNGHIYHPVDLKTIPDNAVVNSLEVRPYLQTYTGVKQHVKIPVLCEKCSDDCDENVWECEIAVCRMAVCQTCAENMEAEWQERAVNGWKYK